MSHGASAAACLLLGGLAACFQPASGTQVSGCQGCRAGSSSGGRVSSAAGTSSVTRGGSSSGSSVSGGSSGASTSGGSSSGGSTGTSGGVDGGAGCVVPLLALEARVYDLSTTDPIAGAQVSALQLDGVPVSGSATVSGSDGSFTLCVPEGVEVTPQIQASGYPTTYLSNFDLTQSLTAFAGDNGIPLLSTALLGAFAGIVSVGNVSTQAAILAGVESASRTAPCLDNAAGWTFALDLADGGVLPDGGDVPAQLYYVASNGFPTQSLSATSGYGLGLFFNVDFSLTNIVSIEAANPDAGPCPVDLAPEMLTGRLRVVEGALTIALLPTP